MLYSHLRRLRCKQKDSHWRHVRSDISFLILHRIFLEGVTKKSNVVTAINSILKRMHVMSGCSQTFSNTSTMFSNACVPCQDVPKCSQMYQQCCQMHARFVRTFSNVFKCINNVLQRMRAMSGRSQMFSNASRTFSNVCALCQDTTGSSPSTAATSFFSFFLLRTI